MVAGVARYACLALWLASASALAQDNSSLAQSAPQPSAASEQAPASAAREAFERGLAHLRARAWADAETEFRRSLALVARPSSAYNLAFVLFKQGRLRESAERLQQLLSEQDPAAADYRDYAKQLLAQVVSQLPMLYLMMRPANASVSLDGQAIALTGEHRVLPVDPGTHQLVVAAPGFDTRSLTIVTRAGEDSSREIALLTAARVADGRAVLASAPARRPSSTVAPWLLIAAGGALLAGAAVTGLIAEHQDANFSHRCPSHTDCDPSLRALRDRVATLGVTTDVLLGTGAVFITGGVTYRLLIGAGGPERERSSGRTLAVVATLTK